MKRTTSTVSTFGPPAKRRTWSTRRKPRRVPPNIVGRTSINEVKSFDQIVGAANLPLLTTPPVFGEPAGGMLGWTCINEITQGNGFSNRIGSKIVMKSIRVQFTLYAPNTLTTTARVFLLYDRQTNGASPASILDMFQINATGTTGFATGLNMANRSRFKVLRDQYFNLDQAQSLNHHVNFYCKGKWEVEYKATNGNIGDITTGSVLFGAWLGNTTGAGQCSMYDADCRIRYYD